MNMGKWMLTIRFLFLFQFGLIPTFGAATAIEKGNEATTLDITGTVKALRQFRLAGDDPSIPVKIRPLLTTLKHQLRDLISLTLNKYGAESKSLENVRKALLSELEKQGVAFERPDVVVVEPDYVDHGYTYGDIHQIVIQKLADHPDLITATTTVGVCCGNDTSLYVYKRINEDWKLVIAQEANDYEDVGGAQGSFSYAVSPPSDDSQFYVVTKDVNPWCTSNWQAIRYQVLRQGPAPYQPRVLLKQSDSIYLGNLSEGSISILPTGFAIEFDGGQRLDTGVLIRRHVVSYQVSGDRVQRVPPFAREPESFLDEWFDLPWEEASKWTHSRTLVPLRKWHERLFAERSGKGTLFTGFVFNPPACQIKNGQWQIGIEFSPYKEHGKLPPGIPKAIYFTVISKGNTYFLKSVSRSGLRKCSHCG
jgi:hypothetical protein